MAHDVFISHSSVDKPTADAVCAALEARGFAAGSRPGIGLLAKVLSRSRIRFMSSYFDIVGQLHLADKDPV